MLILKIKKQNEQMSKGNENLNNAENSALNIADVRRSADMWWETLDHKTRVKYATEQLNKKGNE